MGTEGHPVPRQGAVCLVLCRHQRPCQLPARLPLRPHRASRSARHQWRHQHPITLQRLQPKERAAAITTFRSLSDLVL